VDLRPGQMVATDVRGQLYDFLQTPLVGYGYYDCGRGKGTSHAKVYYCTLLPYA